MIFLIYQLLQQIIINENIVLDLGIDKTFVVLYSFTRF